MYGIKNYKGLINTLKAKGFVFKKFINSSEHNIPYIYRAQPTSGINNSLNWWDITMSSNGNKIAAIEETHIWVSYNSGNTWTEVNTGTGESWTKIQISRNGNVLTAISNAWTYVSTASGSGQFTTWSKVN